MRIFTCTRIHLVQQTGERMDQDLQLYKAKMHNRKQTAGPEH
jgi:hypothetical protein